nr:riboflavin kinase / adenylyltransferase [Candidatus Cloacimonadota bacterium]
MTVISIGTFDGIHLGHRKLLSHVTQIAKQENLRSVVISFSDHPAFTLHREALPGLLCPSEIKEQELKKLGIDEVVLLDFTPEIAQTSAQDFLEKYLIPQWHPKVFILGYDSHFGKNREGNRDFLLKHASRWGYRVEFVEPILDGGRVISSSRIRNLLQSRHIEEANRLLGRPYRLLGDVCRGLAKGRELGFPTANLKLRNPHQLIPAIGLYLSRVHIEQGEFFGLTNIGKSPTVKHSGVIEIETYLLGFDSDIYGSTMEIELLKYLREEKMFANTELLIQAMHKDLELAKSLIEEMQC